MDEIQVTELENLLNKSTKKQKGFNRCLNGLKIRHLFYSDSRMCTFWLYSFDENYISMNCLHTVHAQTVLIKDVVYLLYIKYKFCIFYVVLQSLLSMRVKNNQKYIEHKLNLFFLEKIFFSTLSLFQCSMFFFIWLIEHIKK